MLEWKYTEKYLRPADKGRGRSGETRRSRYLRLYERPASSFNQTAPLDDFFFEPFYQIMRLHLLADRMLADGVTPNLPINEARVIVFCPAENTDYRMAVSTTPLALRFPHLDTVEDVVRATLTDPDTFTVVAPEEIIGKLRGSNLAADMADWLAYHELRYGW